jgi:hypothetical protein
MTRGVLIFAQNNSDIDYIQLAIFSAKQVKKHLDVPVTLVTENREYFLATYPEELSLFDTVIDVASEFSQKKQFNDGSLTSKMLYWKNFSRSDCYDISPYDETIVIDADFIINSNTLSNVWNATTDFAIYKTSYDLAQWRDNNPFTYINQSSAPFYWATVFYFKKSEITSSFFKVVQHIRQNWQYYKSLYSIDANTFRNDFAFSIAIHIFNGGVDGPFATPLPGKLYYTMDKDLLVSIKDTSMKFLVEKQQVHGDYTLLKTNNLDVHVMNKYSLARYINEQ